MNMIVCARLLFQRDTMGAAVDVKHKAIASMLLIDWPALMTKRQF